MKKKILIIIPNFNIGGGAEKVTSINALKLSNKYNISLLTFLEFKDIYPLKGKYYSLKENLGLRRKIHSFFKIYEIIRPFRISRIIRLISPDIIISSMDFANIPAILTKLLFRIINNLCSWKSKNRL